MEDVLDLYAEPNDPQMPVVCFDETSTQLLAETRAALPTKPGRPKREDYEYVRAGTRNLFLTCEPKAGWRHVAITQRRTMQDFAHQMRWLVDEAYPDVPVIRAPQSICQECPVAAACLTRGSPRRSLTISPYDAALRRHRSWMATDEARTAVRMRKQPVEPVFGIIKEQQGVRRFLSRGLGNVTAEWTLLATAFNLRTLWRIWRTRRTGHPVSTSANRSRPIDARTTASRMS